MMHNLTRNRNAQFWYGNAVHLLLDNRNAFDHRHLRRIVHLRHEYIDTVSAASSSLTATTTTLTSTSYSTTAGTAFTLTGTVTVASTGDTATAASGTADTGKTVSLTMDSASKWVVTGTSYLTALTDADTTYSNITCQTSCCKVYVGTTEIK
jgi:hypothetical protein